MYKWFWGIVSFKGRVGRLHYWLFFLTSEAFVFAGTMFDLFPDLSLRRNGWDALFSSVLVVVVIAYAAAIVRRLHDRDRSGWWMLPMAAGPSLLFWVQTSTRFAERPFSDFGAFAELVGWGITIWAVIELKFLRGTVGVNRFGPDPVRVREGVIA